MIGDQLQCEWAPGANRSTVSIEQAADRVGAPDRAELIRQFNARLWVDRIRISRDAIDGEGGHVVYSPAVSRMNFGRGQICGVVTRAKWADSDAQSALVFAVNGTYYGYAAACGNLFELVGWPVKPPPAAEEPPAPVVLPPIVPLAALPPAVPEPPGSPPGDEGPGPGPSGAPTPVCCMFGPPTATPGPFYPEGRKANIAPIPEAHVWILLLVGLVVGLLKKLRGGAVQ